MSKNQVLAQGSASDAGGSKIIGRKILHDSLGGGGDGGPRSEKGEPHLLDTCAETSRRNNEKENLPNTKGPYSI